MKLYLAIVTDSCLMEGDFEHVLGVFSSPELAAEELKNEVGFAGATKYQQWGWKNIMDGELTEYFEVVECKLDKGLHDY